VINAKTKIVITKYRSSVIRRNNRTKNKGMSDMEKDKRQIFIDHLRSVKRNDDYKSMNNLINWLENNGFFESPASTRFHGAYPGGLLNHSLSVYNLFSKQVKKLNLDVPKESIIICSLLHDICKVGAYIKTSFGYRWNNEQPKGHTELSIKRIKQFINLSALEEVIIKYHMGFYGSYEFLDLVRGEYSMRDIAEAYNKHKIAKLFHFCDDYSTQFLEEI